MDVTFAARKMNENSMSTMVPMQTKIASRESQDLVLNTSRLTFTSHWRVHGSYVAPRTADDQLKTKSSEIPRYAQTTVINRDTSAVDSVSLAADHLQLDSTSKMNVGERVISSLNNSVLPFGVPNPQRYLASQMTAKKETVKSAVLLNSTNIVMDSKQPPHVSVRKTLLLHDDVVTEDTAALDSTSHRTTISHQLSKTDQLSAAATVHTVSHDSVADGSRHQFSSSQLQSIASPETTLLSSVTMTSNIRVTSARTISVPLGTVSRLMLQATPETETEDDSLVLNSRNITANTLLQGDRVMQSKRISEAVENTSMLPEDPVTRGIGHYSTSYNPTINSKLHGAQQLSVSAVLQKETAVLSRLSTDDVVHGRFSSSWLQSTSPRETSSVTPMSSIGNASAQNTSGGPLGGVAQFTSPRMVKTETGNSLLPNSMDITTDSPLRDDTLVHSKHDSQMPVSVDSQKSSLLPDIIQKLSTVAVKVPTFSHQSSIKEANGQISSSLPQFTAAQETTSESSVAPTSSIGDVAQTFRDSEYC